MSLRLFIVDDHPLARQLIRTTVRFCQSEQPEIVGEAVDGGTAIELARELAPDVVTMDIGLPDMSGLEVTRRLKTEMPHLAVVIVTMHDARRFREAAAEAGATAYVAKENLITELPSCLDRLASEQLVKGAVRKQ